MAEGRWATGIWAMAGLLMLSGPAAAEFRVRVPTVVEGEVGVEHNGSYGLDPSRAKTGEQSYTTEFEMGVNSWWLAEIEGEGGRDPGPDTRNRFTALTSENTFQLTEAGEYWADFGFFAEYGRTLSHHDADQLTAGPIVRKEIGRTVNTLNVFFDKGVGSHAAGQPQVAVAWQTRITLNPLIEPGVEIYSTPGTLLHFSSLQAQDHRAGPVLYGTVRDLGTGKINYELGYLVGLTRASPEGTVKWKLEYEIHF